MSFIAEKVALRERGIAARSTLRGETRQRATAGATARALEKLQAHSGTIGLYFAFRDEINALPLMEALAAVGRRLALPCTPKFGEALTFRAWTPGDTLVRGRMNIPEPSPEAPIVLPQALVVPPVAFDRRGYRIGYGAGFYDRTIPILRNHHPVFALGFAFACQEAENLPAEQHDVPLDAIATERELIEPERS
jgi:5-formyltetrahydrofolate cyclo-ligase